MDIRRAAVAALVALALTPAVAACNLPTPSTCQVLVGKKKPKAVTVQPKTTVKEPKKGSNGVIVVDADPILADEDDDDCDDD